MENEEVMKEVGTELTVIDPAYVIKPQDEKEITTLVGEINGFLQSGGGVTLPKNYDANGALKSFYLALVQNYENDSDKQKGITFWKKLANDPARRIELMAAARELVLNGLDVRKGQCYFYLNKGGKYKLDISYKGYEMLAQKNCNVDIRSYVIHEGDKITMKTLEETGEQIAFADTNPMNRNKPIVGALAIAIRTYPNGRKVQDRYVYMSWEELCANRNKGSGFAYRDKGSGEVMYEKLVRKALAKQYFRTTDDSDKFDNDGYYVSGEYDNQFQDKSKEEYKTASLGGVTITNSDGTVVEGAGNVEHWYDNAGNPHQLLPDEMWTPYLNKEKQNKGEKYPGQFVGYCKNTRRAVCKKPAEEQT